MKIPKIFCAAAFIFKRMCVLDLPQYYHLAHYKEADISIAQYSPCDVPSCTKKPTAIFVPGIEMSGIGISDFAYQFQDDYNTLIVCSPNTSPVPPLDVVVDAVASFIKKNHLYNVVIVGESAGAILALCLGYALPTRISSVVVMNSATAFKSSFSERYIKALRKTSRLAYGTGKCMAFLRSFLKREESGNLFLMPRDILFGRIDKWVIAGSLYLDQVFDEYPVPTLIIASIHDELYNSVAHAALLVKRIPISHVIKVKGRHLLTPSQIQLTDSLRSFNDYCIIRYSPNDYDY